MGSQRAASRVNAFTLRDFVRESNRIEGIYRTTKAEITAHEALLDAPVLLVSVIEDFVARVACAGLRDRVGMDVRVGHHVPPPGGPDMRRLLGGLLARIDMTPFERHRQYEYLHPFMDGNGRSGRAIWLHDMGGIERAPLGFLHHWYYQSLAESQ